MKANIVKTVIFICHFFFFGLTAIFFLLNFHKRDKKDKTNKAKFIVFITTGIIWIIFGFTSFFYELHEIIVSFKNNTTEDIIEHE